MIDAAEIQRTIDELEAKGESWDVCQRLAWLYIVRDHASETEEAHGGQSHEADGGAATVPPVGGSEFLDAAAGKDAAALLAVVDGHMTALKGVFPKEYESVMRKVRAL